MKKYRWQIARITLNGLICVATAVLFGFLLYGGMKMRIAEGPVPENNSSESTVESESSLLPENTPSIEPSATPKPESSEVSEVSVAPSLAPSPSVQASVSPSPHAATPSPTPKAKVTPTPTPKAKKPTPTPTAKPKHTPTPTVAPTPEPALTGEQGDMLQEMFQALQEKDAKQSSQILKKWYELWESEKGKNWKDITEVPYTGDEFSEAYTGTALITDNVSRFYYGSVKNGVPDGKGVRIALQTVGPNLTTYIWAEGEWSQGVMVGNGTFYLGEVGEKEDSEYESYTQITGTLDGTAEEKIQEGTVVHQIFYDPENLYVARFTFQIRDGKLVASDWTLREDGTYGKTERELNNNDVWCTLTIPSIEDPIFQNPYPWSGEYRYEDQFLFNCPIF